MTDSSLCSGLLTQELTRGLSSAMRTRDGSR
jgi:hypothetical protein